MARRQDDLDEAALKAIVRSGVEHNLAKTRSGKPRKKQVAGRSRRP